MKLRVWLSGLLQNERISGRFITQHLVATLKAFWVTWLWSQPPKMCSLRWGAHVCVMNLQWLETLNCIISSSLKIQRSVYWVFFPNTNIIMLINELGFLSFLILKSDSGCVVSWLFTDFNPDWGSVFRIKPVLEKVLIHRCLKSQSCIVSWLVKKVLINMKTWNFRSVTSCNFVLLTSGAF